MSAIYSSHQVAQCKNQDKKQIKNLIRQLAYVEENIAYYQQLFRKLNFSPRQINNTEDLELLPLLTKVQVRQQKELFLNKKLWFIQQSRSSGFTGEPFTSYFDITTWIKKKFWNKIINRARLGLRLGQRIAILECCDAREQNRKNKQIRCLRPWLNLKYFSIFDRPETVLHQLSQFQPQNLCGYPGHLVSMARYKCHQNLALSSVDRIFTSSEYLSENHRHFIETTFHAPIYDHYGCTEFKEVAWQCRHRDAYHVNTNDVLLEIVHTDHQGTPSAEPIGDIAITDLSNRAMPLVRYVTGDQAKWVEQCACGARGALIKLVGGRSSEQIILEGGERFSPYQLTTCIERFEDIIHFQLIQSEIGKVDVKTVWQLPPDQTILNQLSDQLQQHSDEKVTLNIEVVEAIIPEKSGKTKILKQYLLD